jgi:hypothetical protein
MSTEERKNLRSRFSGISTFILQKKNLKINYGIVGDIEIKKPKFTKITVVNLGLVIRIIYC